uniref:M28 family peptidase n=1 Tax=Eiseniibacteriota bacterium TaxID=2212470 RepID=A0A832HZ57_UNCEI
MSHRRGTPFAAAFVLAAVLGPPSAAAAAAPGAAPAAAPDTDGLVEAVRTLADPRWEGRGVGTAGLDSAAAWIAGRMAAIGLRPAGEGGGWFQPFEVTTGVEVESPTACEVAGRRVEAGPSFQPLGFSANGVVRAPVVFAGYGITAPELGHDDYAGLDVRDRLVLVFTGEPGEMDSTSRFSGLVNTPHAELRTKAINAREHGALGLLVVNGPLHHAGEPLRRPRTDGGGYMSSGLIAARLAEDLAAALVRATGRSLEELQRAIDASGPQSTALPETATVTVTLRRTRATVKNVVGAIPGRDSARTIVVGAHYDHLGYGGDSSLSPDERAPHVGADDNASGTAALLRVAERLARRAAGRAPEHHLVFAAFTAEESGVLGSGHFVDRPPRPAATIGFMLNMDMVGRLKDNRLLVLGTGTAAELPAILEGANRAAGFALTSTADGFGPSDHTSFYKRRVPVLMLFTGPHTDYHRPSDTWDKIHYAGLARIADFAAAVVESIDARPRLTYQQTRGDSATGRGAGGGYGAYLGTIPDFSQTEGGVLLSGVRGGSPAEQAGFKAGDVIVKFDGVAVDNLYDYTFALRSRKPGQQVRVTVKRDGRETDLVATLGRRP